ncbi:MAG: galactokinase, partial [Pseudomonadota bacterium]
MTDETQAAFFGGASPSLGEAPGRVNLIGEHTDYNGGMALPMALPVGLRAYLAPRRDEMIRIASDRFDGVIERSLEANKSDDWADHAVGAVIEANASNLLSGGADVFIKSTIPDGAGLSSSAALIVAVLKAARAVSGASADDKDIATRARRVENNYIGMPCGIMDQMAVAIARRGQAIALDTKTLAYDVVDAPDGFRFAVIHSGERRRLSDGRYAARKTECDAVRDAVGNPDICLLTDEELEYALALPTPLNKRARHCVSEHQRTRRAATALADGDYATVGALMNESHLSMRDDFEMSLPTIDALVADAVEFGAVGARLTGGGFGGCIVACVAE